MISTRTIRLSSYFLTVLMSLTVLSSCSSSKSSTTTKENQTNTSNSTRSTTTQVQKTTKKSDGMPLTGVGNSGGNIVNDGLVAIKDEWLYYSDRNKKILYKERSDGTGKTKITDAKAIEINVSGDWIFYSNVGDAYSLYKVKTDGTGNGKIKFTNQKNNLQTIYCDCLTVVDNWIYFIDVSHADHVLNRVRPDGTEIAVWSDDTMESFCLADGWIYYLSASDKGLYKMQLDRSGKTKLLDIKDAGDIKNYVISDGWVFYFAGSLKDGYVLSKMKTDGTQNSQVLEGAYHFNIAGGWIYYSDDGLNKMKTDGSSQTRLIDTDGDVSSINIAGEWIFYGVKNKIYRIRQDGSGNELLYELT